MKKAIILSLALILTLSIANGAFAKEESQFATNFKAFMIGDDGNVQSTFQYLGEERTLTVNELRTQLEQLGYGNAFANNEKNIGYTVEVDAAFKRYAKAYERKLNQAAKGLGKRTVKKATK